MIWGFIFLSGGLLIMQLIFIVKNYLVPDISSINEKATLCAEKECAFYEVLENPNTVQESAICFIGVKGFEDKYRGVSPCKKSVIYFGKSSKDTYAIMKRRKMDFMSSISSLAGYLALILSLYRITGGK